jgi:amidophosphoribosyltransferase
LTGRPGQSTLGAMCGLIGITMQQSCAPLLQLGLQALQHRGQDSTGIGTICQDQFPVVRHLGLVGQSFTDADLEMLAGSTGIGHVRYPTIGAGSLRNAQPFWYRQPGVLMAHNGNLINLENMYRRLAENSVQLLSRCDIEPLLCIFCLELMARRRRDHTVEDAVAALKETFRHTRGAFSVAAALRLDGKDTLMVFRDSRAIRPAVWGRVDGGFVAASESVALDAIEAKLLGDVPAGSVMFFQAGEEPLQFSIEPAHYSPCVFEYIYFARPDSIMNGRSVYSTRMQLGRELARAWKQKGRRADVVIPIPDTSRPAANALAEELGLPFREGFIKNRYSGRTFIMQSRRERTSALRLKLNPIREEFRGRRVLVVDDSIVRGTTLQRTIELIREQEPAEVHLAIYSPPVLFPCYYGIDMSTREELVAPAFSDCRYEQADAAALDRARQQVEEGLAARLGLDSLTYLPLAGLWRVFSSGRCAACFDGKYPLELTEDERCYIEKDRRSCVQRELCL